MTLYFNGGTEPLVPEGKWGEGVYMPGEPYETDAVLTLPWITDPEAAAALVSLREAISDVSPTAPPEPLTGAPSASRRIVDTLSPTHMLSGAVIEPSPLPPSAAAVVEPPADEGPELHTLDNGDVVTAAGQVVGHIEPPMLAAPTTNGDIA